MTDFGSNNTPQFNKPNSPFPGKPFPPQRPVQAPQESTQQQNAPFTQGNPSASPFDPQTGAQPFQAPQQYSAPLHQQNFQAPGFQNQVQPNYYNPAAPQQNHFHQPNLYNAAPPQFQNPNVGKFNTQAFVALGLTIVGILIVLFWNFLAVLLPIIGIVLGHKTLRVIKHTGEKGRGFAIAALVVGYAAIAVTILAAVATFVFGV
jgi:hypothetical protein